MQIWVKGSNIKLSTHLPEGLVRPEAPTTVIGLHHFRLCIQTFGETLILTAVSCRTHLTVTTQKGNEVKRCNFSQ